MSKEIKDTYESWMKGRKEREAEILEELKVIIEDCYHKVKCGLPEREVVANILEELIKQIKQKGSER